MWVALTFSSVGTALFAYLDDVQRNKGGNFDVPHDPDDFRRCLSFVNYCGITPDDLQRVKEMFPWWGPQIDNWPRLVELWNEESPSGRCPKLYDLLQELENQSMVLAGWKKTGANSWVLGK